MQMRATLIGLGAVVLFGISACSTGSSAQKSDESQTNKQAQTAESKGSDEADDSEDKKKSSAKDGDMKKKQKMQAMCPMKVDGTTTSIEKLEDAVAIDFTTAEGDVDELRTRIQKMAKWHGNRRGNMKKGDKGKKGEKGERHNLKKLMAESAVETEEIDGGMRMKFSPKNPDHLGTLHDHMKSHSDRIAKGRGCPMKMMKGKQAKGG